MAWPFNILICLVLAASPLLGQVARAPAIAPEPVQLSNVEDVSKIVSVVESLDSRFPDTTIIEIGPETVLIIPRKGKTLTADAAEDLRSVLQAWNSAARTNPTSSSQDTVQLFHFRDAPAIVTALTSALPAGVKLSSLGKDRLMILGDSPGDQAAVGRISRLIAVLDQPRPQITLQLWTLQVSDRNSFVIEEKFEGARKLIRSHDEILRRIYAVAWKGVARKAAAPGFWHDGSHGYVSNLYGAQPQSCGTDPYCLGYDVSMEGAPSLSRMLLILALSKEPWKNAKAVLDELQPEANCSHNEEDNGEDEQDEEDNDEEGPDVPCETTSTGLPDLSRTRRELQHLLTGKPLQSFRAAILDYLFHYKWSESYPRRFSGYNLQRSAARIDALFGPLIDAFNTDVQIFVEDMQQNALWPTGPNPDGTGALFKKMFNQEPTLEGLVASGRVKVVSLSGSTAKVTGETLSYFDMTPPPTFIVPENSGTTQGEQNDDTNDDQTSGEKNGAADAGRGSVFQQTGLSMLSPFTAGTVTAALRALQAPQPVTVEVGRNLSLEVTPNSLAEASSAELVLKLTVNEPSAPSIKEGNGSEHLLDRIAKAEVETNVRVPGVRLFEVSNFALDVQAPRPDGIFPIVGHAWNGVFGQVPVLNRFLKWNREPATVYHRNLVVVSAIIAPTAADLSLGLRFHADVLPGTVRQDAEKGRACLDALVREHQRKLHSILGLSLAPSDYDGDGLSDATENCQTFTRWKSSDSDGDGAADASDPEPNNSALR